MAGVFDTNGLDSTDDELECHDPTAVDDAERLTQDPRFDVLATRRIDGLGVLDEKRKRLELLHTHLDALASALTKADLPADALDAFKTIPKKPSGVIIASLVLREEAALRTLDEWFRDNGPHSRKVHTAILAVRAVVKMLDIAAAIVQNEASSGAKKAQKRARKDAGDDVGSKLLRNFDPELIPNRCPGLAHGTATRTCPNCDHDSMVVVLGIELVTAENSSRHAAFKARESRARATANDPTLEVKRCKSELDIERIWACQCWHSNCYNKMDGKGCGKCESAGGPINLGPHPDVDGAMQCNCPPCKCDCRRLIFDGREYTTAINQALLNRAKERSPTKKSRKREDADAARQYIAGHGYCAADEASNAYRRSAQEDRFGGAAAADADNVHFERQARLVVHKPPGESAQMGLRTRFGTPSSRVSFGDGGPQMHLGGLGGQGENAQRRMYAGGLDRTPIDQRPLSTDSGNGSGGPSPFDLTSTPPLAITYPQGEGWASSSALSPGGWQENWADEPAPVLPSEPVVSMLAGQTALWATIENVGLVVALTDNAAAIEAYGDMARKLKCHYLDKGRGDSDLRKRASMLGDNSHALLPFVWDCGVTTEAACLVDILLGE
eukprot:m.360472 g.360472  ORF g.360472 m.360472 type:complete len:612 (-) comp28045_c0_seq6:1501-3336(-)